MVPMFPPFFPLSPNQLIVIGEDLLDGIPHNPLVAEHSKRWIVGARGNSRFHQASGNRRSTISGMMLEMMAPWQKGTADN